jgi:sugar-phosphatase
VRPAALLLDLDGTLVDSEAIHRRGYAAFFAHRGWDVPDLSVFTGRRAEDVFATVPGPWTGLDPQALHAEALPFVPPDPPVPVPGAVALLDAARDARVPVAVVTSAGPAWVERSLTDGLGLPDGPAAADVVVTADDVVDGKPDPSGYALACSLLGVEPGATVVVEDSPAGVRAAVGAGVRRVHGVSTTHSAEQLREAGAVAVHADLTPLAGVLLEGAPG